MTNVYKYFKIDETEEYGVILYKEFEGEYLSREVYHYDKNHPGNEFRALEWDFSDDVKALNFQGWTLTFLAYSSRDEITKEVFENAWELARQLHQEQAAIQAQKEKLAKQEKEIAKLEQKKLKAAYKAQKKYWKNFWANLPEIKYKEEQDLIVEATHHSPYIHFRHNDGVFLIQGKSELDEPAEFYAKVIDWMQEFFEKHQADIVLKMDLDLMGIHDEVMLLDVVNVLAESAKVEWYYEDEDQEENGVYFAELFDVPFYFVHRVTGERSEFKM